MAQSKIVIAHRGASGYLPEHTQPAYAMAYALGADYIEPDVVMTADRELICLHDIHLDRTTDVAERFPERARGDGRWYAADFTYAEIATLAALERVNDSGERVFGGRFQAQARGFQVPRLAALIEMVQSLNRESGRDVGIYPETKDPAFHAAEGLALSTGLLEMLARYGYTGRDARVFVQSFDADDLRAIRVEYGCDLSLIQLVDAGPADDWMVTDAGLERIAEYADGIGPNKERVAAGDGALVAAAHARGLQVHPYTFRADQLGVGFERLEEELARYYFVYDVDAVFTDFADIAVGLVHPERCARLYPK